MRRILAAVLTLFLPLLAVVATWLLWREDLPDRLASHWSGLGTADDTLPTTAVFIWTAVVAGLAAIGTVIVLSLRWVRPTAAAGVFFFAGLLAGEAAALWLVSAGLTLQAGSAEDAVLGGWILVLLASAAYGLIPYAITPKPVPEGADHEERIELKPTETGAWSTTITGSVFAWVTLALVVLGVVLYGGDVAAVASGETSESLFGMIMMGIVILVVAPFSRLRVTIDWRGLRVVSSFLRIPLKRMRLGQISTVEAAELRPQEWGGWGYRIMPGRSALILRKGPGLIVSTVSGKQFALTLDKPQTPAALLRTLRDQSSSSGK